MAVIIYALSNPAMPNLVKIGKTTSEAPRSRMDQIYNTSVPLPFELVRAVGVQDEAAAAERRVHGVFSRNRINPSREFFEIDVEQVGALFDLIASEGNEDVTSEINTADGEIDSDSRRAADLFERRRRPN